MFIALSLFLPHLFGLGFLVTSAAPGLFKTTPDGKQDALRMIAVILIAGILSDYLLVLVLRKLGLSLIISAVLALLGLIIALWTSQARFLCILRKDWVAVCVVIYLTLLYGMYILFEPLSAWDARSIWFFHGKIIFYDDIFSRSAGWIDPYSNVAYPKLVAVLAAQFAYVAGFWNEYFPKAALLAILIPALFAMQSFINAGRISFYFLIACCLLTLGWWLWNGYMDGYLALYAALSMLFFGRWLEEMDKGDLYAGIVCLGVVVNLKDEGLLFFLVVTVIVVALRFTRMGRIAPESCLLRDFNAWVFIVLSSLGLIIWYLLKWQWGIGGDSSIQIHRISIRLIDGSLITIMETLLLKNGVAKALGVFAVSLILAKLFRLRTPLSAWLAILTSLVYFSGMLTVYLATSHDLAWHLSTSSDRTMLPVLLGIFSATFILVQRIEASGSTQGIHPQNLQ